jgi:hypothetical protein
VLHPDEDNRWVKQPKQQHMKTSRIVSAIALMVLATVTSCKKNYTCTCTTVLGTESMSRTHSIDHTTYIDAKQSCNNYEEQANSTMPGGTTCHL